MSNQIQHRRGTTSEHSTFTGADGEITIDTDKETAVVHDGSTAGGFPLARESALAFLTLSDTPSSFSGETLKVVRVNAGETALEFVALAGGGDFLRDGSLAMTGDFDGDGNNLSDCGVLFLREQASADADVAGQGQWWVLSSTPCEPYFTDDAGNDKRLASWEDTLRLATYNKAATGTESARSLYMPFDGQIDSVGFALSASDSGTVTVRVVNDAGSNTSEGTASITTDDCDLDSSISWSTGSGSFSSGDRLEIEPTSGFSSAGAGSAISVFGTRSTE